MTATTLQQIGKLLGEIGARGAFSAKRTRPTDDLAIEVKGVGRLRFPVSLRQAEALCRIGRPARYGRGEQTLLDPRVRDAWQIPKSRIKIDLRQWKQTLLPVLEALRADLGLPADRRLKAELHAMLVYAPGQFFLPHRDSEKADGMVGTLVVTLPSAFKGGSLVVEHQDQRASYRGSKQLLSFVAFYADCRHEVKPVTAGYRIVLTYTLTLDGAGARAALGSPKAASAMVDALTARLRDHFETPLPPRSSWDRDQTPRKPPSRLVYLLDHQYTKRGLGWRHLKGNDAVRATALRTAAESYGCELVLALSEVHEIWNCTEPGGYNAGFGYGYGSGRGRSWSRDDDDSWVEEDPQDDGPDAYELNDLIDGDITLTHWVDAQGAKATPIMTDVAEEEVCSTTPSSALEAYASEYEGNMGNYGNTMDRWYRRAALVLWPLGHAFAIRAEASPIWALATLMGELESGARDEAKAHATTLLDFWPQAVQRKEHPDLLHQALRVADRLDDRSLATALLEPFPEEALEPAQAPELVALMGRYGKGWAQSLMAERESRRQGYAPYPRDWLSALPRLCKALDKADPTLGRQWSMLLVQHGWDWTREKLEMRRRETPPSLRTRELKQLAKPLLGVLRSSELIAAKALRNQVVSFLRARENESLLPCLLTMVRTAARAKSSKGQASPGLDTLRQHCIQHLEKRLASPARKEDDWSIHFPEPCQCKPCAILREFLADPEAQQLDWPLAKPGRLHVHQAIDAHELPVSHKTRRSGSPYTLVLTKTEALFKDDAKRRRTWQSDLDWLHEVGARRLGSHE